jgi:hypothetical protein
MSNVDRVRAIRDSLPSSHEWDERDVALLALAESMAADVDRLEADIAATGTRNERGRLNTAIPEVRQARVSLARILREVEVPEIAGNAGAEVPVAAVLPRRRSGGAS